MDSLTPTERATLAQCEQAVESGKRAWIESGKALRTIRDSRLYRESFATFEQYVEQKWGMARRTAYQMIDGVGVVENVRNCAHSEPPLESQIRPLTTLPPEQQREAWNMAIEAAPKDESGAPQLTAKIVESIVNDLKQSSRQEPIQPRADVIQLPRRNEVTIPIRQPEKAVEILLKACDHGELVKFASELNFALHRIGAINKYREYLEEVLAKVSTA